MNAGVRHVVAIEADSEVLDQAARDFAKIFYHNLMGNPSGLSEFN